MSRATTRTYGVLYLIRCDQNGLYKIGITNNWAQRRRQLRVGETTTQVHVVRVNKAEQLERYLHRRFSAKRLPQSEWFSLDSEDLVFVRSVFLKASSDYKAGGHKSPEVEAPPPPPSANPPPPANPGPPTAAQVMNSGIPEGWSDQQARASANRHAAQAARQAARAAEQRRPPEPVAGPAAPVGESNTPTGNGLQGFLICFAFIGFVASFQYLGEQRQQVKPAAPQESPLQATLRQRAEEGDRFRATQAEQPQPSVQPEQLEETPLQAMERRRAEAEALREMQAAQQRAKAEQIRLEWEHKEQARYEKAQAYIRSQCLQSGLEYLDPRCKEARGIVSAYRARMRQRQEQEARDYFNDPTSPVPPPKATPPSTRTTLPPLPVFPSP